MTRTWQDRFWEKLEKGSAEDCWLWRANQNGVGYGRFYRDGAKHYAHRVAYELLVGPIPAGLSLDHLCRNRLCCNPRHLEPVTHAENLRRGQSNSGVNARKVTCLRRHLFTKDNTRLDARGNRQCRTCDRLRWEMWINRPGHKEAQAELQRRRRAKNRG